MRVTLDRVGRAADALAAPLVARPTLELCDAPFDPPFALRLQLRDAIMPLVAPAQIRNTVAWLPADGG